MAITSSRLVALISEADRMERAYGKFREEIEQLLKMEKTSPGSREGVLSMLQYSLDTNPVPALPRRDVEKHHYFLTRKDNERKKLHARRKRAGEVVNQNAADALRQSRIPQEDFDLFSQSPKGGGGLESPEGSPLGEAPSADDGFPVLGPEDL